MKLLSAMYALSQIHIAEAPPSPLPLNNPLTFITAGLAKFTVLNADTGNRYTYKVVAPTVETQAGGKVKNRDATVRFVSVLTGADNETDYTFAGTIFLAPQDNSAVFRFKKGVRPTQSAQVFNWYFEHLIAGNLPPQIETYHEGCCGRCGRTLTVPESILSGYGPECITKVGR